MSAADAQTQDSWCHRPLSPQPLAVGRWVSLVGSLCLHSSPAGAAARALLRTAERWDGFLETQPVFRATQAAPSFCQWVDEPQATAGNSPLLPASEGWHQLVQGQRVALPGPGRLSLAVWCLS